MAQNPQTPDAVVINMEHTASPGENANAGTQDKKKQDTLFGPNIGIVSTGPKWTESSEKSADELTPEIVKSWVAKSKETNHATTTLQALVNLKRPTLRLSPLEESETDDPTNIDSQHHHGLEFEYDCDAPKCGIYVHVILSPSHHLADKSLGPSQQTKLLVFETVTDGGFGKILKLEDGAMLELGRFEHRPRSTVSNTSTTVAEEQQHPVAPIPLSLTETPASGVSAPSGEAAGAGAETPARPRKRFTHLHFRRRNHDRAAAGPALAVVDVQPAESSDKPDSSSSTEDDDENNLGVKVTIRLVALDEDGKALPSGNAQTTYLHIVRYGAAPVQVEGAEPEEDKRPWVVKVVKREATIGQHTFHLHEIYGLSANSTTATHAIAPTAPPALETHSYPPTSPPPTSTIATTPAGQTQEDDDGLSSECLLCLSSPREVVLLPCRHLVACRECAVNMIEFGAGGNIVQNDAVDASVNPAAPVVTPNPEGTSGENGDGEGEGEGAGEGGAAGPATAPQNQAQNQTAVTMPPTPAETRRRKRKAKGWFCPVCRQPYTSMLRITTTPPSKDITSEDGHRDSASTDLGEHEHIEHAHPLNATATVPQPSSADTQAQPQGVNEQQQQPAAGRFLRVFGRGNRERDVERGVAANAL